MVIAAITQVIMVRAGLAAEDLATAVLAVEALDQAALVTAADIKLF